MQENKFLKFLSFMWNPLSWVMEAAAIMAIVLANGGVSRLYLGVQFNFSASLLHNVTSYSDCSFLLYNLLFFFFWNNVSGAGS
jgi:hypothetical protein